ncbi:mucin-4-like [Limosa lapponica baueri]|uniref:Mucin-4-like n=1 Tax=Limosa lapponica baueri TaxID=1758121 RepID=A0A2I0U143_LIMLA|nr:mucin-4-like [Limosa lapponica baueri]
MAGQRGGLSLPLLLLSLAVPDLALGTNLTDVTVGMSPALPTSPTPTETSALVPTTNSTTAATIPPSRPETSSPEVQMDASTASTTLQEKGGTAHSTPRSAAGTMVQPDPIPTELGVTTVTPTPIPTTPDCAETTIVTSVGTSSALAVTSFGIKAGTLPSPTSILLSPTRVATTLGTSQRPAVTTLLGSTSPGTGSASSLTPTSDEPSTTPSDTTAALMTSTGATGSTPTASQPAGTTAGTSPGTSTSAPNTPGASTGTTAMDVTETVSPAFPTSLTSMKTSALVPTTDSTTAGTIPPSSPETGASTLETSPGTGSASLPTASSPTTPASTDTSAESLTTVDTTATSDTSTGNTRTSSQPVGTTPGITSGTSTATAEPTPDTSTVPETSSAATGLRAAAAVPVTTEEPFTAGTASPITVESEVTSALMMGTVETSTAATSTAEADAEIDESIRMGNSSSPSFPPGAELGTLGTAASQYDSTIPPSTNATEPLSMPQDNERGTAALAAATTADTIVSQDPAVTSDAELDVMETTPDVPLGATPLFADTKGDILADVTREGAEDQDLTAGAMFLPTTPPLAAAWGAQPSAGSPAGAGVTMLPSQELTTAMGAVEEGVTLPVDIQSEASAISLSPSSGARGLLTTQQDGATPSGEQPPLLAAALPYPTDTSSAPGAAYPPPGAGTLSAADVAAVPLYGYGARENDREYVERRVDFNSPLFKPETGFPFGRTLRDSLYFTDNGQIIFPSSDNSIFTYPNPPPSGFNGHEEVPMIAVFWDNADFSRGVGTTFYQEFHTLNTAKPLFVRDVEAKIRRYLRSSYSAAWTLKITWEKAPAYAARTDTRRTNTYQAILTTDGFRSYVLMLYQEGGMQWDYTRLAATNVLIGYTSGDGFYRNDDLTQRPPAAKYRPDQFRGYNTDLRGMWIYKLENRVSVNYRLKCLAWTGRQQDPRTWSQDLPACPCSLQQGQQDPRFKSSRGGK